MENEKELRKKLLEFLRTETKKERMIILQRTKKYRDIYQFVLEKTKEFDDIPLAAKVYFVVSEDYSYRKCSICGKDLPHNRRADPIKGYASKYCSVLCAQRSPETRQKIEETSLKKYGTKLPQQSACIKEKTRKTHLSKTEEEKTTINEKRKKTCLEKYGVSSVTQVEEFKEKFRNALLSKTEEEKKDIQERTIKTNLERYGVEHPSQSKKIIEKLKQRNLEKYGVEWAAQTEEVQKKIRKGVFEKYGVEYISQAEEIKQKVKKTFREKFGVEHPMNLEEIKEKQRETVRNHFGVDSPLQNKKVLAKVRKTNIERYGGPSPLCSHEVRMKSKAKYVLDGIYFDSSAELAYYIWLRDNNVQFEYHPKPITYVENGVEKRYFPDFLVEGKIHEIKGDLWWENASEEKREIIKKNAEKIFFKPDYKKFLDYVTEKYGKHFLSNCKKKKSN